jgi:hypothetical protein
LTWGERRCGVLALTDEATEVIERILARPGLTTSLVWTTRGNDGPDCRIFAMRTYAGWPALRTYREATGSTGPRGKRPRRHRDR